MPLDHPKCHLTTPNATWQPQMPLDHPRCHLTTPDATWSAQDDTQGAQGVTMGTQDATWGTRDATWGTPVTTLGPWVAIFWAQDSHLLAPTYSMIVSVWHKLNHYNSWNNEDTSNLNITYESLCFGIYRYLNKKLQNGCFLPLHMLLIAWVYQQWFWILCSPKLFLLHFLPICQAYLFAKHKMLFLVLC